MTRLSLPILAALVAACASAPPAAITPPVATNVSKPAAPIDSVPQNVLDEVDRLITALYVDDIDVRATAASSLGSFGPSARRAIPQLVDCIVSEGEPSDVCADSLGRIGPLALPSIERILAIRSERSRLGAVALDAMRAAGFDVPEHLTARRSPETANPGSRAGG
jgi:hypothetical protein